MMTTFPFNFSASGAGGQRGLTGPAGLPVDILATAPASPTEGYTYYNTTDHKLWYWNGTAWVDVTDAETFDGQDSPYYLNRDNHTGPTNAKTTPVDADNAVLLDSAASGIAKKLSWANIKATLKAYFDTLYAPIAGAGAVWGAITGTLSSQSDLVSALAAALGIGKAVASGTAKSVLFVDAAGKLGQNTGITFDESNNQLRLYSQPGIYYYRGLYIESDGYGANSGMQFVSGPGLSQIATGISDDGGLSIGNFSGAVQPFLLFTGYTSPERLIIKAKSATSVPYTAELESGQTAPAFNVKSAGGTVLYSILPNGGVRFASMTDSAAANDSTFYSTTKSKLCYKDSSGTVNALY